MNKTPMAPPVTPTSLTRHYRQHLIEDIFVSTYHHLADEQTLRAMAQYLQMLDLFLDGSVMEVWSKLPLKSKAGAAAYDSWSELNEHAQRLREAGNADQ